jgi:predicted membrane-bound dolichyl-phosphate-mannose-protein mannosyltransferase
MTYHQAVRYFKKRELRALAKCRKIRWYSYLNKRELAFRLFGEHPVLDKTLMLVNQCRRYGTPLPAITL